MALTIFRQRGRTKGAAPGSTVVTTSSTEIVPFNDKRSWCYVTNIGVHDIFLAIGQTAELNKGMFLGKLGGSMLMDINTLCNQALNGITINGTTTVIFQENK